MTEENLGAAADVDEAATIRYLREDPEKPAPNAFPAHADLARAIAESLDANPHLRVVGILGRWGSGKSMVVGLTETLCARKGMRFFTYDAWLHHSDAPRRAFIEELLRFVARERADLGDIQAAWDALIGRSEKVEIVTRPRAPIGVGLVLAVVLGAALALNFVRADWRDWTGLGVYTVGGKDIGRPFAWAALVAALPFAAVLVATLWSALRLAMGGGGSGVLALFANRVSETRTDVRTRQPDPTTLEFQRFLRLILAARAKVTSDRLVLVVDNLDRLPDNEAVALWSTVRGLFHGKPLGSEPAVRLPTVLLPVDPTAIRRWQDSSDEDERDALAIGFEDKTFDLVFRVPIQVHSTWQRYLEAQLLRVFHPGIVPSKTVREAWAPHASRILEELGDAARTPRALNAFVNQVAVVWLQWRDRGPGFAAMAFYAAHARKLEAEPLEVLKVERAWMTRFETNWAANVAAICYGETPEVAIQILLEEPLQRAAQRHDEAAFDELAKVVGFPRVLRKVCEAIAVAPPMHLSSFILFVARLNTTDELNIALAWEGLAAGAMRQQEWSPVDARNLAAWRALVERTQPQTRRDLLRAFPDKLQHLNEAMFGDRLSFVAQGAEICLEHAEAEGLRLPPAVMPGGIGSALAVCTQPVPPAVLAFLRPQISPEAFGQTLGEMVADGRMGRDQLALTLERLRAWEGVFDWEAFVRQLEGHAEQPQMAANVLLALTEVAGRLAEARAALSRIVRSNPVRTQLLQALSGGVEGRALFGQAVPLVLALLLAEEAEPPAEAELVVAITQEPDLPAKVASQLDVLMPTPPIRALVALLGPYPGLVPLIRPVLQLGFDVHDWNLETDDIVEHASGYAQAFRDDERFWPRMARQPRFWKALGRSPEIDEAMIALRGVVMSPGGKASLGKVLGVLSAFWKARRLREADWETAVLVGGPLIDLAIALYPFDPTPEIWEGLRQGLRRVAPRLGGPADKPFVERWFGLAELQPGDVAQRLYVAAAGELLIAKRGVPAEALLRGGDRLLTCGPFEQAPNEFTANVLRQALEYPPSLTWLAERAHVFAPWVRLADAGARAPVLQRLQSVKNNNGFPAGLQTAAEAILKAIEGG